MIYALRFSYVRRNESRMKKSKLSLGIVTALLSIGALAGCNEVTAADGLVLEYTDAQGNKTSFTAKELFGEQYSASVASTDFDAVYEVLIRKYYESGSGKSSLQALKDLAQKDVQGIKDQAQKNSDANKTSYQEEFSKLLASNNVENVDELYEAKLYAQEKKKFEDDYENDEMVIKMRDGDGIFSYSPTYGTGNDGYLYEQLPYTISHILVKLASATNGEHAQATISEAESRKLGQLIEALAGANIEAGGRTPANTRSDFGSLASDLSEDPGSKAKFGQLDVMDRRQADSFINEFKFGIYAYEAIYNQVNINPEKNAYANEEHLVPDGSGDTYTLLNKLKFTKDATYTDKSIAQTAEEEEKLNEGEHFIRNYFATAAKQIGRIPYGAAVALASESVAKNSFNIDGSETKMNWEVNGNSATFYPRNILFNKYFNNHRVAVIVPNEIAYNDPSIVHPDGRDGDYTTEDFVGVINEEFKALPGFSVNTKDVLPASILGQDTNVLTTEKGQVILAVRGGSSGSYEGIHFMVIDRSALDEYVELSETVPHIAKSVSEEEYEAKKLSADVTSLSDFYTIYKPGDSAFPTYAPLVGGSVKTKTTYVNQYETKDENVYSDNAKTVKEKIRTYSSNKNTFMFQTLIEGEQIQFADNDVANSAKELIQSWIRSQRTKSAIDSEESFDNTWATYIEYLTAMDEARALNSDGSQRLISETCAIGYNKTNSNSKDPSYASGIWATGGACYAK